MQDNPIDLLQNLENANREALSKELAKKLEQVFSDDFSYFYQILYRIDINEEKVNEILAGKHTYKFNQIAELIIERQLIKIETRKKYSR